MKIISYVVTALSTLFAGYVFFDTMLVAETIPQQQAGILTAVALAVLPYIFARSVEKLGEVTVIQALERHWERMQEAGQMPPSPPQPPRGYTEWREKP